MKTFCYAGKSDAVKAFENDYPEFKTGIADEFGVLFEKDGLTYRAAVASDRIEVWPINCAYKTETYLF